MLFPISIRLLDLKKNPPTLLLSSEKQTPALGVVTFHFFRPYLHKSFTGKRQLLVGHFLEWEHSREAVSLWYKPVVQQAEVESCCCHSKLEYS